MFSDDDDDDDDDDRFFPDAKVLRNALYRNDEESVKKSGSG